MKTASGPRRQGAGPAGGVKEDIAILVVGAVVVAVASYERARPWLGRHRSELLVLGLLLTGVAVLVLLVLVRQGLGIGRSQASANRPIRRTARSMSAAGWATRAELRPLVVRSPPGNRIVLGRSGRCLVSTEVNQSVLLIGPTQSGKTSSVAIPAILEWRGPVIATSVKADLVRTTIEARTARGPVSIYDPSGVTGLPASGWSPLPQSRSWTGAKQMAAALCSVARLDGGMEDAGFWYSSAEKLLAPLLLAAATAGGSMADVVRWIDDEEIREPLIALELAGVPDAIRAARTSFAREDRQRSSIFATAETVVAAFSDPNIAASTILPGVDAAALVDGTEATLYCCAPARDQERLRPVFVSLLRQIIDAAFDKSVRMGRPLDPPLLVVLDEAANIAPLSDLDTLLATASSHGIQLLTVWQDMAQIEARYDKRWPTIVNNHRAKVLCPGICDPLTLDHVSALIGDGQRSDHSTTVSDDGRWSRTESSSVRRTAPSSVLRQLPPGQAVVVYGALPPARVRLRPYYESVSG